MVLDFGGKTPYEVLGVPASSNFAQVRKQFLEEARKWHPDKRQGATPEELAQARERFVLIHAAYQELLSKCARPSSEAPLRDSHLFDWVRKEIEEEYRKAEKEWEEQKLQRQEIEEYMNELRATGLNLDLSDEERQEILKAWHTVNAAFYVHEGRERSAEMRMKSMKRQMGDLKSSLSRAQSEPPRPSEAVLGDKEDSTASFLDVGTAALMYVGESVTQTCSDAKFFLGEMAEDFTDTLSNLAGYFSTWRLIREDRDGDDASERT